MANDSRNRIKPVGINRQTACQKCRIRRSTLFGNLADENSQFILGCRHNQIRLKSKTTLFVQNSTPDYVYTVHEGWMILYVSTANGKRQILRFVLPGEMIGMQTNSEGKVLYSASSITPVTLCTFSRKTIDRAICTEKEVTTRYMQMNSRDASLSHQYIVNGGQKNATERVAVLLMELFYRCHPHSNELNRSATYKLHFPLTQEEIGDAVGLTNVHVNRVMQGFKRQGMIDCKNKQLIIHDLEKLDSLADFNCNLLN